MIGCTRNPVVHAGDAVVPRGRDRRSGLTDRKSKTGLTKGQAPSGLGTFAGVFTPSILTILGIILFLRMGFVVGQAGLLRALIIVGLANLISTLTSFSLAAIATNLKVKGGGDYFLISRTLGREYGGALGIVLFLAQSISIAFYSIGFGEAAAALSGFSAPHAGQLIAAAAVVGLFVLAWLGSDWATKFQFVIMGVLFAAIVVVRRGRHRELGRRPAATELAPLRRLAHRGGLRGVLSGGDGLHSGRQHVG